MGSLGSIWCVTVWQFYYQRTNSGIVYSRGQSMKPKFYDIMRSKGNRVIFGTLAGQAYHLGAPPRLYRLCLLMTMVMTAFLVNWPVVIIGSIIMYVGISVFTPNYDPMYDSTSPDFDENCIGNYWWFSGDLLNCSIITLTAFCHILGSRSRKPHNRGDWKSSKNSLSRPTRALSSPM